MTDQAAMDELRAAFEHYRSVQCGKGSEFIKENGRNGRSPHTELIEAVYDLLYCTPCSQADNTTLRAENERLSKRLNNLAIGVRNACTILGVEIFLAEHDKPRLYEPAVKVHNALRKLVEAVEAEIGKQ